MQTDEEKMGVTYKEISDMIEIGKTNKEAMEKIVKMYEASKHKRASIPVYKFDRRNYLVEEVCALERNE